MADLNANRRRRLLARLDAALSRLGAAPARQPARPAAATVQRRAEARTESQDASRGYVELREAVRSLGGIRPTRDFPASEIPRDLRARRGAGLAPDEMAQVLTSRGFHYASDDALVQDAQRRQERARSGREGVRATRSRTAGAQTVCGPVNRGPDGRFRRV